MSSGSSQPPLPDGSLDFFILNDKKKPDPIPVAISQEIRDRGSLFEARIYRVTNLREAKERLNHVKHFVHRKNKSTHDMSAWRIMTLKAGKSGLGGSDEFELIQGSKDDGEAWAAGKILKVMQNNAVIDAVVIVSRWQVWGYIARARQVLSYRNFTLESLDSLLADSRQQLAALSEDSKLTEAVPTEPSSAPPSLPEEANQKAKYEGLDLARAKRLIQTRERSLKSVQSLLAKKNVAASRISANE
ncbi:hypothetical protein CVT24_005981 [Panaeolus cyanescens]|uniref:Impact N-terminal domain-containing protein n=1 Tax=Panaeolus cyanescens TaxID=181874 RepID=A0A409VCT7_9AGAR|nr:hypothetical protein CVT24_005981 [Panaeolus cyanescens]